LQPESFNRTIETMRLIALISIFVFSSLSHLATAKSCDLEISHKKISVEKEQLVQDLIALSLSKTNYTPCFIENKYKQSLARRVFDVSVGRARLTWTGSSPTAEEHLRAIRIPVFKGLLSHRILIIRKGDQEKFDNIQKLNDFRILTAGAASRWVDRFVLESAGIKVAVTSGPSQLWPMLAKGRFDYMSFGMIEAWQHFPEHSDHLAVEEKLILHYPIAFYIYVNKDDDTLYEAIKNGMEAAIKDGSYDKLLFGSKIIQDAIKKTNIKSRRFIYIDMPDIPKDTPFDRKELWVDPMSLDKYLTEADSNENKTIPVAVEN